MVVAVEPQLLDAGDDVNGIARKRRIGPGIDEHVDCGSKVALLDRAETERS